MRKKPLIDKGGEVRELFTEEFKKFKPMSEAKPVLLTTIKTGGAFKSRR